MALEPKMSKVNQLDMPGEPQHDAYINETEEKGNISQEEDSVSYIL